MLSEERRAGVPDLLEALGLGGVSKRLEDRGSSRMGNVTKTCKVADCDRDAVAKDMCLKHYKKDRYSPWGLAGRPPKPQCAHCDRTAVARGLCQKHWKQWQLWGDPLHADNRRAAEGPNRIDRAGYLVPRGKANVPLHRIVTGAQPGDVVHHINGVKADCVPGNLAVLKSQAEHKRVHNSLEQVAFELVRCGVIAFDHENLHYVLAEDHAAPSTAIGRDVPLAIAST
jgi:hypothetical protein